MPTPSIQTLTTDAQQVLNLDSISAVRSVVAVALANANTGTPLNPNLTTQQLWNEFYQVVTKPKSDIESIIANQLMKFLFAPPAPGGVGADKQVIFNDGGVLAGDPQFLWDKTANLLTVTGSATITGDLTVDTSTLKVTASTDTVTVGATTTDAKFRVVDASYNGLRIGFLPGTANYNLYDATVHEFRTANVTPQQLYTLQASSSVWYDGAGGTRMTLNSTGLGVGGSVVNKLTVTVAPGTSTSDGFRVTDSTRTIIAGQTGATYSYLGIGGNQNLIYTAGGRLDIVADSQSLFLRTGTNNYLNLDTSGNVGIGVTPSAWGANYKAFQIGAQSCLYNALGYITSLNTNAYENSSGQIVRIANGEGTRYVQAGGSHQWFYAANASAGTVGGFTQAMTLDAGGNLLVGKTAASVTTVGFQTLANGEASTAMSSSTNAATTWNVYSTGAAAYRFYVGMGGTVYATNTTISAISDQRLKENVQDIDVGLGAILALKPRKFDWKDGKGKNIKGDRGFIAQEFEQVFPQLVDEWADPAPEGETPYKSVRQDLIPVLVKAIQELTARVQTLETR